MVANDKHTAQSYFVDGRKLGLVSEVTGYRADESHLSSVSPPLHLLVPCVSIWCAFSTSVFCFSSVFHWTEPLSPFFCPHLCHLFFSLAFFHISVFWISPITSGLISRCVFLTLVRTSCCGTGIGFKWVHGKKTRRHLKNDFSLDSNVDPSLRTELFPFTWSFFYSSPIYILASWFPYLQNNPRKLPKGHCQEVPWFSRFPQPSFG